MMKSRFGLAAALLAFTLAPTDAFAWDFFAHYTKRMDTITSDVKSLTADTTNVVVLLGDSLTEGNKVKELCGRRVVNMGIGGDQIEMTTAGVRRRVPLVVEAKPVDIFLLIGINDFGSSKPMEKAQKQYTDLVADLKREVPDAKVHIQSLLPTSGRYAHHIPTVQKMNKFLKEFAAKNQLEYVDLYQLMSNEKGEFQPELTSEGLHLTPAAYEVWNAEIEKRLGCGK